MWFPKHINAQEYIPRTDITQQIPTLSHALCCCVRRCMENIVSGRQSTTPCQRKHWTKAPNLERRELEWPQHYIFTMYGWQRLAWLTGYQLKLHFTGESSHQTPSQGFSYLSGHQSSHDLSPESSFSLLHSLRFINSILDNSSPHTFPSSRARLTGSHPEHLGTGSSRMALQPFGGRCDRGCSLCCEDFSTHQALHGIDLFGGGGGVQAEEQIGAVVLSFSIHHLNVSQKQEIARHIHQIAIWHHFDLI